MFFSRTKIDSCTVLQFIVVLSVMAVMPALWGQDAGSQPSKGPVNVAKAGQPASADNPPTHVADVQPTTYVIGPTDVLSINVWKEQEMSKVVPVRPDGMISLPLVGEIKAAGLTPVQLEEQITGSLKKLMSDPQVTVIVAEVHSQNFNIVGEVLKPGSYPLTHQLTVLDAIALAGGFHDFAKTKKIYVLRTDANGKQERLPFNYKDVIRGQNPQQNIQLQAHDTVVVP
jgi:polysaccharide biosynthesis/export protein